MNEPIDPAPRLKARPPLFVAGMILLAAGTLGGCGSPDAESLDLSKSRAIAAEKGIGPQGKAAPAVAKSRPSTAPAAPPQPK